MPIAFTQFRPFAKNNQKTCPSWTAKKYALSLDSEHYFFTNSEWSKKLKRWLEYTFTRIKSISWCWAFKASIWIVRLLELMQKGFKSSYIPFSPRMIQFHLFEHCLVKVAHKKSYSLLNSIMNTSSYNYDLPYGFIANERDLQLHFYS